MTIVGPEKIPFTGTAKGKESVVKFAIDNFSQLQEQNAQIDEVVAQGNTVVVFGHETGRFKNNQRSYAIEWVQRFRIADGKIDDIKQIFDTAALGDGSAIDE